MISHLPGVDSPTNLEAVKYSHLLDTHNIIANIIANNTLKNIIKTVNH